MSLNLTNLNEQTRKLMLEEIDLDISQDKLYLSTRLSNQGLKDYPTLLRADNVCIYGIKDRYLKDETNFQ